MRSLKPYLRWQVLQKQELQKNEDLRSETMIYTDFMNEIGLNFKIIYIK